MQIISKITDQTKKDRAVNALCANYNYEATIIDPTDPDGVATIPNPETSSQFADRKINEFIKDNIRDYESRQLENTIKTQKEALQTDINNLSL